MCTWLKMWMCSLFRGGLVFKAHRLFYHSTLGVRVIKKKQDVQPAFRGLWVGGLGFRF